MNLFYCYNLTLYTCFLRDGRFNRSPSRYIFILAICFFANSVFECEMSSILFPWIHRCFCRKFTVFKRSIFFIQCRFSQRHTSFIIYLLSTFQAHFSENISLESAILHEKAIFNAMFSSVISSGVSTEFNLFNRRKLHESDFYSNANCGNGLLIFPCLNNQQKMPDEWLQV